MDHSASLLQRYRSDRRKLLEFLLSTDLVRAPALASIATAGVELDTVSADYVLECIQSGGDFDPLEASERFSASLGYPIMLNSSTGNNYFLLTRQELSGSSPARNAPQVGVEASTSEPLSSAEQIDDSAGRRDGISASHVPSQMSHNAKPLSLGLPTMTQEMSDDDIQRTAYEILLASFIISGRQVDIFHYRKNGKGSKFLSRQVASRDDLSSTEEDCNLVLMELIRAQLEVSEAMGIVAKKGLQTLSCKMMDKQNDVPHIILQLLRVLSSSDFPSERSYLRWLRRQAKILEEFLLHSIGFASNASTKQANLLSKLKHIEDCISAGPRAETLTALQSWASGLSRMQGKFGIPCETYYWTGSYHFNIKLYERLLYTVFDVLDDGQLLKEVEEILAVLRLVWPILGITEKMHAALFAWVLFLQFIQTGELKLLKLAVIEVHKALSFQDGDGIELYISSLRCSILANGGTRVLNLVDAVLFNINSWCCDQLEDYHLHFDKDNSATFRNVLALAVVSGSHFPDECAEIKYTSLMAENFAVSKLIHVFVEKSIEAAYRRVLKFLDAEHLEKDRSLIVLANKLKAVAEKENTLFTPVLSQQYPEAGILATVILHQLYGDHLKPFLEMALEFSGRTIEVLVASYSLERYLSYIIHSACGVGKGTSMINYMHPYQISRFCSPLILQWVQTQQTNILEWTQRAIDMEDWEPLSSQQRQAASIIEVFRIIEETIDQFFNLKIPMGMHHLQSLLIGVGQSLEAYVRCMVHQQVDKSTLYPTSPPLTRYSTSVNPFAKKKHLECSILEEKTMNQLNRLTLPKLCVKLNTLHYIREQLDTLEDAIKNHWALLQKDTSQTSNVIKDDPLTSSADIDELFTTFDNIRRGAVSASDIIVEFIGARAIFWDLRGSFIFPLYQASVENARFEIFVPVLDEVLDRVCDLIIDTLRDQVVSSIFQATMDGFIRVILDGGPSRVFSQSDAVMMQEDLNLLKDFFIANGQGLPQDTIEKEARLAEEILDLYAVEADTVINMLMGASQQISKDLETSEPGKRSATDADTLLRVLCHKKDKYASEFLKIQYQLPRSSDYEGAVAANIAHSKSPLLSNRLGRKSSFDWTQKGQRSFRIVKKKLQEASSEIRFANG